MKPDTQKSKAKTIKKTIRADIKLNLIKGLKEVAEKFKSDTAHLEKDINKSAKQLAKKFAKEIKAVEPQPKEEKATATTEAEPVKEKPAKKNRY